MDEEGITKSLLLDKALLQFSVIFLVQEEQHP